MITPKFIYDQMLVITKNKSIKNDTDKENLELYRNEITKGLVKIQDENMKKEEDIKGDDIWFLK